MLRALSSGRQSHRSSLSHAVALSHFRCLARTSTAVSADDDLAEQLHAKHTGALMCAWIGQALGASVGGVDGGVVGLVRPAAGQGGREQEVHLSATSVHVLVV